MARLLVANSVAKVGHGQDVQRVWEEQPKEVPQRFVREDAEINITSDDFQDLPIIDLSKLINGEQDEISKLNDACEHWGFFQVLNHGVDVHVLDNMEKVAKEFFMLPFEEKNKYPMPPGTAHGYGQAFVFSEEQKLDWCNMYALGIEPPSTKKPELWTTKPENFSETLEIYSREIRKFSESILEYISISLGLKGHVLGELFGYAVQAVRMNYYPPCARPELVLGLSPHSDGSGFTVLHQGKDSPIGLQILKGDKWLPVQVNNGALVINIGDSIEVITNGKYKSIEHRALTNKDRDRLTIVTFYAPSYDLDIGPIPELVDENNPCKYRTYSHWDYTVNYISDKLNGKRALDFAKLEVQN